MRQPNAPNQPGPPNHVHRLPPIPTINPHEQPQLRPNHSDGPMPPPLPARPGVPEPVVRPLSSQGLPHHTVTHSPFPAPPPPPPLPPRIVHSGSSPMMLSPSMQSPTLNFGGHGGYNAHGLSRPMSTMNLNAASGTYSPSWVDEERQRREAEERARREQEERYFREEEERRKREDEIRRQREEEERKAAEEERTRLEEERERLRVEHQQLAQQALELQRLRQEAEDLLKKEQEELERQQAKAKEEEEKRAREEALRKQWEEEERVRRAKWEDEERQRVEVQRAQWLAEEMERTEKLRREYEDAKMAAVVSVQEEMEAEHLKREAEQRMKEAELAARAEAERQRELDEQVKKARLRQEDEDAAIARRMAETEEQQEEHSHTPVASNPVSTVHTPPRQSVDLPVYEPMHRPPNSPPPHGPTHNRNPSLNRPHANTIHGPPQPTMPQPQHHGIPPLNTNNMHMQPGLHMPGSSPNRHTIMLSPQDRQSSPNHMYPPGHPPPNHMPPNHSGPPEHILPPNHAVFPNVGTGGPPFRNHYFPNRETDNPPNPAPVPVARPGPNKLVRQSVSLGGANPGRLPAHGNKPGNPHTHPGPIAMPPRMGPPPGHMGPPPGHMPPPPGHHVASASSHSVTAPLLLPGPGPVPGPHPANVTPPSSGRPSTAGNPFSSPEAESSSSNAGTSSQPMASTSSSSTGASSTSNYPYRGPSEPLSGIVHGFGRPVIRHQELPAPAPLQDVIIMEPEPSPPFHIVSHTWKHLLKFMASQSTCRVEPSPAALAREKGGPPNLRVVMHFVKLPVPTAEWRIVLYLAVQSITPPPDNYPKHDTSVVPYLFPSPEPGRPLANNPETQIYTIPTEPLPVLPLSLPHLAPYLQAALEESQRSSDSRSRLHKLVNMTIAAANASEHGKAAPIIGPMMAAISGTKNDHESPGPPIAVAGASGQKRNIISRIWRPKSSGSKGKGVNDGMFDVVTPYNIEYQ